VGEKRGKKGSPRKRENAWAWFQALMPKAKKPKPCVKPPAKGVLKMPRSKMWVQNLMKGLGKRGKFMDAQPILSVDLL